MSHRVWRVAYTLQVYAHKVWCLGRVGSSKWELTQSQDWRVRTVRWWKLKKKSPILWIRKPNGRTSMKEWLSRMPHSHFKTTSLTSKSGKRRYSLKWSHSTLVRRIGSQCATSLSAVAPAWCKVRIEFCIGLSRTTKTQTQIQRQDAHAPPDLPTLK